MLAAGWYVAKGRGIGRRAETTIALTPAALDGVAAKRHELLGEDWLARWKRSGARMPAHVPADEQAAVEVAILGHGQFQRLGVVR